MKSLLSLSLVFVFSLFICFQAHAQQQIETAFQGPLMGGPGVHNFTNLEAYLKQPDVMGRDVNFTSAGIETGGYVGGMLRGIFLEKIMVGLTSHGLFFPKKSSSRSELNMNQKGFYGNLGFVAFNRYLLMGTIYGGIGYDRFEYKLTNTTDHQNINFFPDEPIPGQSNETYVLEGVSYELGFSIKRYYPFQENQSKGLGLVFGADIGGRLMTDPDGWNAGTSTNTSNSSEGISTPPVDNQLGAYLRLTLGIAYYELK